MLPSSLSLSLALQVTPIDRTATSVSAALASIMAFLPRLLGFIVILVVGWLIASLLARAVGTLLRAVSFNELARRSGISDFIQSMGTNVDAAGFVAKVAKWIVRIIALVVAFDALGLPAVSEVLQELLLWLPNLIVALVMLVLGGLAANALSNIVRGATAEAELGDPDLLAGIAKAAVWGFAIIVAVNQLGIAQTLVNTLFTGIVAAISIALGLAFGLGGKDAAARTINRWSEKAKDSSGKMREAARNANERASEAGPEIARDR